MGGQPMSDKDAEDASDMSDIVERLREMATGPVSHRPITAGRLCNEAAAEIERLRDDIERLRGQGECICPKCGLRHGCPAPSADSPF